MSGGSINSDVMLNAKIPPLGQTTSANALPVVLPVGQEVDVANQTAFGEVSVAQITPTCAWKHWIYMNMTLFLPLEKLLLCQLRLLLIQM